ncbi:hypothetical protein SOM37_24940 [Bacillus thuringiensis]|uniref:hypothetical protein n=1 Tax=Bacillus thuringiensis TaxID=1428 RepID=UPI002A6A1534|nr:hypothetical protein [Bacillus thuringiensis]MDY0952087.1 hypothetical protein [Bacillus thuringiensis]
MEHDFDYRDALILLYFHQFKGKARLYNLLRLLALPYNLLDDRIDFLIDEEMMEVGENMVFQVTNNGMEFLQLMRLSEVDLHKVFANKFTKKERIEKKYTEEISMNINDIYLPQDFSRENVIYSKKELDRLF